MMGWIENRPYNVLSWFFVHQHPPAKKSMYPFRFISLIFCQFILSPQIDGDEPRRLVRNASPNHTNVKACVKSSWCDDFALCTCLNILWNGQSIWYTPPLLHHSGLALIQATTMNFTYPNDSVCPRTRSTFLWQPTLLTFIQNEASLSRNWSRISSRARLKLM
jgi:hypothetical protein